MSPASNAGPLATPEAPWLGLRSFTEGAHGYFFGRTEELEDLFERIVDKPLTVLFGRSGLGKSSLLQASLIPRLRERKYLPVLVRFDHEPGSPPLEEQLLQKLLGALEDGGHQDLVARLRTALAAEKIRADWSAAGFLWLVFHDPAYGFAAGREDTGGSRPRPVFLVDQFEEIFTLGDRASRRPVSATFRDALSSLVENRPPASLRARLEEDDALVERINYQAQPARVLLSLREDFLHVLERWRRSIPSLMENRFELRMLTGEQALEAVVQPGRLRLGAPPIVPDEVGRAIVRFVAGVKEEVPLTEIDAVPPLLSLVCSELNAQRLISGEPQISRAQFEGHSDEILKSFYNRSFDPASYGSAFESLPDAAASLQALQRLIEDRLVSPDGFRENIAYDTIARDLARGVDPDTAKATLEKIVERRLLTVEERGGVRRLELTHDVLAPIVRASRDDRHEKEAIDSAKRDKARAEAEVRKALAQRNRLRRWVALSLILALFAGIEAFQARQETVKAAQLANEEQQAAKEAKAQAEKASASEAREKEEAAKEREAAQKASASEALEKQEAAKEKEAADRANHMEGVANDEATKEKVAADEARFVAETSMDTLKAIYDIYAANTLGDTPGISGGQAKQLQSKLRLLLLERTRALGQRDLGLTGVANYVVRLDLDEGQDDLSENRYSEAASSFEAASLWAQQLPSDTAEAAELRADILLEQARVPSSSGNSPKAVELGKAALPVVRAMEAKWPGSWRLRYDDLRLLNLVLIDGKGAESRRRLRSVADQLDAIVRDSGNSFEPAYWRFVISANAMRTEGAFDGTLGDFTELRDDVVWFRSHVLYEGEPASESKGVSDLKGGAAAGAQLNNFLLSGDNAARKPRRVIEVDEAARGLGEFLSSLSYRYGESKDPAVVKMKRALLEAIGLALDEIDGILTPNNQSAYDSRGIFLELEQKAQKDGSNSVAAADLDADHRRHQELGATIVSVATLEGMLVPAVEAYTAADADDAKKGAAMRTINESLKRFNFLNLIDSGDVLLDFDLINAISPLEEKSPTDPLAAVHAQMIAHYMDLYRAASPGTQVDYSLTFSDISQSTLSNWFDGQKYEEIVSLYDSTFRHMPIAREPTRDQSYLVIELKYCAISLLKTKPSQYPEARRVIDLAVALSDEILKAQPWNWYSANAYRDFCYDTAVALKETGHPADVQPLLRRAWINLAQRYGKEAVVAKVRELPLLGEVPPGAAGDELAFFGGLADTPPAGVKKIIVTNLTIPCDFGASKGHLVVYIVGGPNGYAELLEQFRWVKELHGGNVAQEYLGVFEKLDGIARENKVDYRELVAYAVDHSHDQDKKAPEQAAPAEGDAKK